MKYKINIIIAGFLLSSMISFSSYSGERVDIGQEIENVESLLHDVSLTENSKYIYKQYSEVLAQIRFGRSGEGLQKYPQELSRRKINRIKTAISSLPNWAEGKVSAQEVYRFFNYIEQIKSKLKALAPATVTYALPRLRGGGVKKITIFSTIGPKSALFLDFNNGCVQSGTGKSFKKAVQYRDFLPVAELIPHNRPQSMQDFYNEIELLELLTSLPDAERPGLVDLLGHLSDRFFQTLADEDLIDFYTKDIGTWAQKINIISQLASGGLVPLHKLGISHNDIKLENVLLRDVKPNQRFHPQRYVAKYNDFGLSTRPQIEMSQGKSRFNGGTTYTVAPEIEQGWIGSEEERVKNYLKADVFSQSIVALYLLKPFESESLIRCQEEETFYSQLDCRSQALAKLSEQLLQNQNYKALDHLLLRGLENDPVKRISAEQFSLGMDHIKKKATISDFFVGNDLKSLNFQFKDFPKYTPRANAMPQEAGEYFLKPTKVENGYSLVLHYMDQNYKCRKQALNINPLTSDNLADEIKFLQEIGTLKTL